jgi:hypothetical protein
MHSAGGGGAINLKLHIEAATLTPRLAMGAYPGH